MSGARRRRSGSRPTVDPRSRATDRSTRRPSRASTARTGRADDRRSDDRRFWGWHRLRADWAARIVAQAGIGSTDLVLDLGAGDGALTAPLAATGARVLAIELHPRRAEQLRRRFADQPHVTVIERDLLDLRWPRRPFRVVANPPWSLAKQIISSLTAARVPLLQADLLLQRGLVGDLARRGRAGPGARSRYRTEYAASIPGHALTPTPPGPAALLRIVDPSAGRR